MCEARVYVISSPPPADADMEVALELPEQPAAQLLMEDVVTLQDEDGVYVLVNLLGEQKLVRGRISRIDFLNHAVYLDLASEAPAAEA